MTSDQHQRARELAMAERIEGIGEADLRWLAEHTSACGECAGYVESIGAAVNAMRAAPVLADLSLVRATQAKIRRRASEMQAHAAMMRPLWIAVALVCAWTALTTPVMWAAFAWLGTVFHLSNVEWRAGFALSWLAPSVAASFILLGCESNRARWRTLLAQNGERA